MQLQSLGVRNPDEFGAAFTALTQARADAVVVLSDAMFFGERKRIADLASANRLRADHVTQ